MEWVIIIGLVAYCAGLAIMLGKAEERIKCLEFKVDALVEAVADIEDATTSSLESVQLAINAINEVLSDDVRTNKDVN